MENIVKQKEQLVKLGQTLKNNFFIKWICFFLIIGFILFIILINNRNDDYLDDYGKHFNIKFPKNLELIKLEQGSDYQDFYNLSIYKLKWQEREIIAKQIKERVCDSINKREDCWIEKEGSFFYKYSDSVMKSEYYIKMDMIRGENYELLIIYELKL
jgi:hypothetical protein